MNARKGVFVVATVVASTWLLWLIDNGLQLGWPPIVLRNWQEFGLWTMHGALVTNPGGFEATTQPDIYGGMSPLYLYPIYFCIQAFRWTGLDTLPFHALLALLVFWGIWSLMRKNTAAMIVAAIVLLTPGYGRWQRGIDPNAISVLCGFPYAVVVISLLKQAKLGLREILLLAVLTTIFVALNWTTAWFLAPFGIYLLLDPQLRQRPVLIYLTLTAIGSILFVGWSMHTRYPVAGVAADAQPHRGILGGYTWGNYGYYEGLGTVRFFLRLFFVNVVGLLPLIIWWFWRTASCIFNRPRQGCLSALPLLMALLVLIAMRNYFCHHPWMASPVAITGLVLSLALLARQEGQEQPSTSFAWGTAITLGALVYGLVVLAVFRANAHDEHALIRLVRHNVPRTEGVAIIKSLDPATAALPKILGTELDRRLVRVDTVNDIPRDTPFTILSSHPIDGLPLVAESPTNANAGLAAEAADWFNHTISRRKSTDRIEFLPHYFLYRPAP
jgi:hypothetical protein